ncbi:DNA repair protein RecO [Treponema sp. R80B11-R83G3]
MSRTSVCTALVLRNRPSGESNSEVTLLAAEEGVIKATVFGGPKSKLRAHSAPYNSGQVWIYRDKSKDYAKITDFDVHSWRAGLRELYERTMTAAAIAETILSSHGGGGEWQTALTLATETLDTLETANEELCQRLLIHFLWRWSGFLGIQPHLETCAACGKDANCNIAKNSNANNKIAGNSATNSVASNSGTDGNTLWYSAREDAIFCSSCVAANSAVTNCAAKQQNLLQLNPGSRRWLSAVSALEAARIHRYSMDKKSFNEAKSLVTAVLSSAIGKRLNSWDW